MTYDPVDADDDGTVESDVDNTNTTTASLDADEATIGRDNEGTTNSIIALPYGLPFNDIESRSQYTEGVGTSAKTIHSGDDVSIGVLYVMGREGGDYFVDEVAFETKDGTATQTEKVTRFNPAAREYTVSNNNLQLAMSSDTYDVVTLSVVEGLPDNP